MTTKRHFESSVLHLSPGNKNVTEDMKIRAWVENSRAVHRDERTTIIRVKIKTTVIISLIVMWGEYKMYFGQSNIIIFSHTFLRIFK